MKSRLERYAETQGIDFAIRRIAGHRDGGIQVRQFGSPDIEQVSMDDLGYIIHWGDAFLTHPSTLIEEPERSSVPYMNHPSIQYAVGADMPKWMFRLMLDGEFDHLFPKEVIHGMGMGSAQELHDFRDALTPQPIMAVRKPLCIHHGIGISYLSEMQLNETVRGAELTEAHLAEVRAQVAEGMNRRFHNPASADTYLWPWTQDEHTLLFPVAELGASILQEFVEPLPVRSRKTGQLHQGNIRAIMIDDKLIGAFYRFPETPYTPGQFARATDVEEHTFVERVDEQLERRIGDTMRPVLQAFKANAIQYKTVEFDYLSRKYVQQLIGMEHTQLNLE